MSKIANVAIGLALISGIAVAQPMPKTPEHAGMAHGSMAKGDYMAAMQGMHEAMMKADDRDADRAFALKMIEHHRGAISMAQVLMKHGNDAELKKMTEKSSSMQQKQIAELQRWLDRHGGRRPQP